MVLWRLLWGGLALSVVLWGCVARDEFVIRSPAEVTGFRQWDLVDSTHRRSLTGYLWYPVSDKVAGAQLAGDAFQRAEAAIDAPPDKANHAYPLVVLINGALLGYDALAWLAESLVANGYCVATVGPKGWTPAPTAQYPLWQIPQQVSALLTDIERAPWASMIDFHRIACVGYGSGGLAALWLIGAQNPDLKLPQMVPAKGVADPALIAAAEKIVKSANLTAWRGSYRDPRIRSAVLLAPEYGWIFRDADLGRITAEVMIVSSSADTYVPQQQNAVRLAQVIPGAEFYELQGRVHHWDYLGIWTHHGYTAYREVLPRAALPVLPVEHRREIIHEAIIERVIPFIHQQFNQ